MPGHLALARQRRRSALRGLLVEQHGVLRRRQLYELGWTRWEIEAEIAGGRWRDLGASVVATHCGPLTTRARWWAAVMQVSPRAAIAGMTALQAAGLTGVRDEAIHVAVPPSCRPRQPDGVSVHQTRRFGDGDLMPNGLPRMRVAPAAVQAAIWAGSDRQAALFLVAPVQQRLVLPSDLDACLATVRRDRRRSLMTAVVRDLKLGAQALGELDFAALCRSHGLPEPSRQRPVSTSRGRRYLDVEWEDWGVAAEIDGIGHMRAETWLDETWRHNAVVLSGRRLLRFPQLAIRLEPDAVMDQTRTALVQAGWAPGAPPRPR